MTLGSNTPRSWIVLAVFLAVVGLSAWAAATRLGVNTDLNALLSQDLDWVRQEAVVDAAFPLNTQRIAVVIDGADALLADTAAAQLAAALEPEIGRSIATVYAPGTEAFFKRTALLYASEPVVEEIVDQLLQGQAMLAALAEDPSIVGLASILDLILLGVDRGEAELEEVAPLLDVLRRVSLEALSSDGPIRPVDWAGLAGSSGMAENRRFVLVQPISDTTTLQPVSAARAAIREALGATGIAEDPFVVARVTGDPVMADDEFATVADGMGTAGIVATLGVVVLLTLGLRRFRLILAIMLSLIGGLIITFGFAAITVGDLNPISIAFAVMFIGLAVDFGIQYAMRLRSTAHGDTVSAPWSAARQMARPLTLAGAATAIGFLAFLPTDYVGVSQLGLIAGAGMVIAVVLTLTVLPVLVGLLGVPSEEGAEVGFDFLRPVDRGLQRFRIPILTGAGIIVVGAFLVLPRLGFDFNPINLRSGQVESVATALELLRDPDLSPLTIETVRPTLAAADELASSLSELPDVARVLTIRSFVPEDQEAKLRHVQNAAMILGFSLDPFDVAPPPSDDEMVAALASLAEKLGAADPGLAETLTLLAGGSAEPRARAAEAVARSLPALLDGLRAALASQPVTLDLLPDTIRDRWLTEDGQARVEVQADIAFGENEQVRNLVEDVLAISPDMVGTAVTYQESADVVVGAFRTATILAIASITLLLLVTLRSIGDTVRVLLPLFWAGAVTLALTVLVGLPINFANIIALPLLLGIGVAFNIYFVVNWRRGVEAPLAHPTSRAVLFSAATTGVAFGSLMLSAHPGTASMGQLLLLALCVTLVSTLVLMPALLGAPRGRTSW